MAFQIATAIHQHEHGRHPEAEVKRLILEALRPQRFFDDRGYVFVRDLQGNGLLQPLNPELENTSLWDNHDDKGHFITRGLIAAARSSEAGGFSSYRWYPPDNRLEMSDKLAYVRLFAPYGWAMGTGDYLDLWHAARLKEGIERLRAWKFGDTGRFEVLGLDGQILLQPPSPGDEGKNYRQLASPEEQDIQRRMLALANEGGGLMEYAWRRQGSDIVDTRCALVQRFAPWNIVLVATLSSREIQATIDAEKASACRSDSSPRAVGRQAVRFMRASMPRSTRQLNAAAAPATNQMPRLASAMCPHWAPVGMPGTASTMPMKAQKTMSCTTRGLVST